MRIAGVNIPNEKKVGISLTYVFGVGKTRAARILDKARINRDQRTKELSQDEMSRIQSIMEKDYKVEGELRQIIRADINRLKMIKSYRGIRLIKNLPARGQRTKSNSRTVRGNVRRTAGSGKRKAELK